jgi:hypothetical protein
MNDGVELGTFDSQRGIFSRIHSSLRRLPRWAVRTRYSGFATGARHSARLSILPQSQHEPTPHANLFRHYGPAQASLSIFFFFFYLIIVVLYLSFFN